MKRILLCMALILGICAAVFSFEGEHWLSLGLSFENVIESGDIIEDMYMGSLGFDVGLYNFFNRKDIGLFMNAYYFIPLVNSLPTVYAPIIQYGFLLGPGFRYNINETMKLHFGVGFNMQLINFYRAGNGQLKLYDSRVILGIGGDVGFKYELTDIIYLNFGAKLSLNFANYMTTESSIDNWETAIIDSYGWVNNYLMFEARPYFAVGFNFHGESRWGKPYN